MRGMKETEHILYEITLRIIVMHRVGDSWKSGERGGEGIRHRGYGMDDSARQAGRGYSPRTWYAGDALTFSSAFKGTLCRPTERVKSIPRNIGTMKSFR